ncbi:unnamed protein product [Phaedon cochleariae]|uniref:Hypoxia up-regulated protein 1 n=1 Tax=Phaedon cochleariae TaxID=80249 RepID=A0A9N9X383_PHACE|nr:unnamed protein product [Phaedon cochleariae]
MVNRVVHFLVIWLTYHVMVSEVSSLAVMSVDLGSEWMKVGIVSPGVPMEIALNKESKRKTPAVLSFRDNTRLFGEDAMNIGVRFPKQAFGYLLDLLGKRIDHPLVKQYQERFPYYDIIEDSERGTILFKVDEEISYSPEELIAQMLVKAREFAENGAHQPIKECVLTVPGYFNQVERRALLQAAELAGLKVLQLINDYTAVAINYGIFRSKTFNETAQYVIFYDMGASSTTAMLVSYQTIKTKEKGYVETLPQASVLGVGYDRTLGGLEMQIRLRNYLATKFNEMKKTKTDIFTNTRAMAKLFKEAGRLKTVLSANAEHFAQVENLLDEQDFKVPIKREEMENLCQDLFERVKNPVEQALKTAHLTIDVVSQVVLVGAGTRVPKVQEYLQKAVGRDLAKNLNTDEAAAMGAVYKAADLSTGFKVAKFITKDAVLFPIQVTFNRATEDGMKQVKRTLFGLMNPYPQKKIITFNKHSSDFSFNVNYAELDYLPLKEVSNVGSTNLSEYVLSGVGDALKKNSGENMESKGIKAHFAMDDSGLLSLHNVELVVEKTVTAAEEESEGPLSKIGSTITKLFGGEDDKLPLETNEESISPENQQTDEKKPNDDGKPTANSNSNETAKNATAKETKKDPKPKIITIKEPIKSQENVLSIQSLNQENFASSLKKLQDLEKVEKEINRRATALNSLESFVIDIRNKLLEEEYIQSSTQEDLNKIEAACTEISEWLYEDGSDANADTYEQKHDELHALTKDLFSRVWEHKERPEALKALHTLLNQSSLFLENAKNATKANSERDIFTDVEVETLSKVIIDTTQWRDDAVKEQDSTQKHEPVKLTVKMIVDKMAALDREVKYLVSKAKLWKPKKVEKVVKDNSTKIENENVTITEETIQAPEESESNEDKPESSNEQDAENHLEL